MTLQSYQSFRPPPPNANLGDLARHGPVASAITEWVTAGLKRISPGRPEYQNRDFALFLWFALGVGFFYALARRWIGPWPAVLVTSLWASQPLLVGHAFINPSDMPFLTLFLAAVLAGFRFADAAAQRAVEASQAQPDHPSIWRTLRTDWRDASRSERVWVLVWCVLSVLLILDLFVLHRFVYPVLARTVQAAYSGTAWPPINQLFRLVAEDATRATAGAYQARLLGYYASWRWAVVVAAGVVGIVLLRRVFPSVASGLRLEGRAALAGVILGLATATRLVGPLAGLLVTLLVLIRSMRRGLTGLLVYWSAAAVVGYLAWPILWGHPWATIWGFLHKTAVVPFAVNVLFRGTVYRSAQLPWSYVPTFLVLQTTLPALALAVAGGFLAIRSHDARKDEYLVVGLWLVLPLLLAIGLRTTLYDNARHYLFMRPAAFFFAGLTIEALWSWGRSPLIRAGLAAAILLPGIVAIVRLHPYEYVYFNELAGGVRGASRAYEMDYWATSYRETMAYINREALPDATVVVGSAEELFDVYARPDLHLARTPAAKTQDGKPEFAMITTRSNADLGFFSQAPVVFRVEVDGATLALVRRVP